MSQVVSSQSCLENSTHLTRTSSDSFYHSDNSNDPIIIDKNQIKRLYRLQRTPYRNTNLYLDKSDGSYEQQGYFENILQKQINESSIPSARTIYHKPTDMSDESMARFSFGKTRPDPQRIIPNEITSTRNHPAAITILRHEQGPDKEIVPRFTDRSVSDRTLRGRIGPGGSLNPNEDTKQAQDYLRNYGRLPCQPKLTNSPRISKQQSITDELARHYMYTSTQQAAFDEVAWDTKLPSKIPVPITTYEANGSDPLLVSRSLPSFFDVRTQEVLDWDRRQSRYNHFYRKPFHNVAPLPRAYQISGYSGIIGGSNIEDIDNPTIDFKPTTIVRSEQPKFSFNSFKPNIPYYTGKTHWTKTDRVSHHDQSGHAYTTTAAFHKSLPIDSSTHRHAGLHGQLSRIVTTVLPQNPYNQIDKTSTTINASIDSRSHVLLRQLPAKKLPTPPEKEPAMPTELTE